MIVNICCAICIICLCIITLFQRKDIDNLRKTVHELIVIEDTKTKLWNHQILKRLHCHYSSRIFC